MFLLLFGEDCFDNQEMYVCSRDLIARPQVRTLVCKVAVQPSRCGTHLASISPLLLDSLTLGGRLRITVLHNDVVHNSPPSIIEGKLQNLGQLVYRVHLGCKITFHATNTAIVAGPSMPQL